MPQNIYFNSCKAHPRTSNIKHPPRFHLQASILVLKGRILDRIALTASAIFFPRPPIALNITTIQNHSHFMMNWRAVLLFLGITKRNVAGLCRVIVGDRQWAPINRERFSADENAAFEFWSACRCWSQYNNLHEFPVGPEVESMLKQCDIFIEELAKALSLGEDGSGTDVFDPARPLTREEDTAAENSIPHFLLQGRSFCVTEQGRTCNAMHEPEKGDLIAAFEGGDRLFILRPVGDRFRLVGEAYVDGLINGEAYEGLDPDEVDYDIELV